MQNRVINMCEKFHYDRLRNDRALGSRKSDNNKNPKNNVGIAFEDLFPGSKVSKYCTRGTRAAVMVHLAGPEDRNRVLSV